MKSLNIWRRCRSCSCDHGGCCCGGYSCGCCCCCRCCWRCNSKFVRTHWSLTASGRCLGRHDLIFDHRSSASASDQIAPRCDGKHVGRRMHGSTSQHFGLSEALYTLLRTGRVGEQTWQRFCVWVCYDCVRHLSFACSKSVESLGLGCCYCCCTR